jgi:hypothetical protein
VSQPRFLHEIGDRKTLDAVAANPRCGYVEDAVMGGAFAA